LQPGEGEARWFLDSLLVIKASKESTNGSTTVIECHAPGGDGSPLHVHHREDEYFFVIDGELQFVVDGERLVAPAGAFVLAPRGVPHAFRVSSEKAHFLLMCEPAGFEEFVRATSVPAEAATLPPPPTEPPDFERFAAVAAEHGIEFLGPSGLD
jgi:mannose-6-phosphate isomerase-like protein (cupin superfamily)